MCGAYITRQGAQTRRLGNRRRTVESQSRYRLRHTCGIIAETQHITQCNGGHISRHCARLQFDFYVKQNHVIQIGQIVLAAGVRNIRLAAVENIEIGETDQVRIEVGDTDDFRYCGVRYTDRHLKTADVDKLTHRNGQIERTRSCSRNIRRIVFYTADYIDYCITARGIARCILYGNHYGVCSEIFVGKGIRRNGRSGVVYVAVVRRQTD